jgi:uncharacterized protein
MLLEGVVTNVTNFGAFVDIGVHQDGLVHISQLADKFVKDPHDVVKAGQIVNVQVQDVDISRKRIALTMKLGKNNTASKTKPQKQRTNHQQTKPKQENSPSNSAMAAAFQKAGKS